MSTIQTLTGPIDSASLGATLIHEHVFVMDMEYTYNYRPDFFAPKTVADAAARLNALKASGIDAIIDLTVLGLGRHVPSLVAVAQATDLRIIASTGAYTFNDVPAPFQFYGPGLMKHTESEPLVALFVGDIVDGMAGSGVRAGELKCAIDAPGLTPGVERVLRSVAQAHRQTGVPITVHTDAASHSGLVVQRVLAEEGVDLSAVVIGHCGDTTDIDYLMRLADAGSILGMDRFGIDFTITMQQRVDTIIELVRRGYAGSLALGHDCCAWSDFFPDVADYHQAMPNHHYLHIHQEVLPALRGSGLGDADLETMFVANPRRHFEAAAAAGARY